MVILRLTVERDYLLQQLTTFKLIYLVELSNLPAVPASIGSNTTDNGILCKKPFYVLTVWLILIILTAHYRNQGNATSTQNYIPSGIKQVSYCTACQLY